MKDMLKNIINKTYFKVAIINLVIFGIANILFNIKYEQVDDMIIYPSPVSDLLFIKGIPLYANKAIVSIISMNGQCMFMKEVRNEETEISCSSYPTGTYLLRIVSEDKVTTRRFIKK